MIKLKIETYLLIDEDTLQVSKIKNRFELVDSETGVIVPFTFSSKIWGMLKSILSSGSGEDLPSGLELSKSSKKKLQAFLSENIK